jgi:hypothetical protein
MKSPTPKPVKYLFIDLETKSAEPIENGATRYFADPSADWLICSAVALDGKSSTYTNFRGGKTIPKKILNHTGMFVAHNWFFEWSFFNRFYPGTRAADYRNWLCTAAMARWFGICAPRAKLEDVAIALRVGEKMPEGKRLIVQYCIPQKDGTFLMCNENSEDAKTFVDYCWLDAYLSRKIFKVFSTAERKFNVEEFRAAQAINVRGVPVDAAAAQFLVIRKEKDKANADVTAEKIAGRTAGGALVLSSNSEFIKFFKDRFAVELPNAQAGTLDALDFSAHTKADEIENVLYVRKLLVARAGDKAQKILDLEYEGRVHDATIFHAAGTGRFQSWGVNFFNFSRQSVKDWDAEKNTAPVPALQRGIVAAPKGRCLIESDWRGIENYLSLYYAGDTEQLSRIEAGESPYLIFGEKLYGEKITKEDKRYVMAKMSVLGFGYGAGAKKFAAINRLEENQAVMLREAWTKANARIVRLWDEFSRAFKAAALKRDKAVVADSFIFTPLGNNYDVKCVLPDGHNLYFRDVVISSDSHGRVQIKRGVQTIHGGLLLENMMQAVCARLLYRALVNCEKSGLEPVLHIYDSIIIESDIKKAEIDAEKLKSIMCSAPEWASDLKLAVDIKTGIRWSK